MSVTSGSAQATFAATLVDEWIRGGVTDAVICPGSRSAPLATALAARPELRLHLRLDERGAGFFALGLARATGRPALVLTTSGTAAAELHAAVLEAHHGRVPLVVCTADRPPELHHVGAAQTVEQAHLYGGAVRWFAEPGTAVDEYRDTWRPLAARALAEATVGPTGPGPVHLNLAFRDPLTGSPGELPPGRAHNRPVQRIYGHATPPDEAEVTVVFSWPGRRGVIVAGEGCGPQAQVLELAERLGWPVLADPRSGCRISHPHVVAAADAVLRQDQLARALEPQVVVALGAPWASKVLGQFVAAAAAGGAEVLAVDPWWRWVDPDRVVHEVHRADPAAWLSALLERLTAVQPVAVPDGWLSRWRAVEAAAQREIDAVLGADQIDRDGEFTEPVLARFLYAQLAGNVTVVAGSSMPVRDLEWYGAPRADAPRVVANRGANGIDGVCSTALGLAAAGSGPVVALVGDLSFLHDASSLVRLSGSPAGQSCTLVVVDNRGGGIFSFLPQARALDRSGFEQLFGTPPETDVAQVAAGFGLPTADVSRPGELAHALSLSVGHKPLSVVRVRVPDRAANAELHERVNEAVVKAARMAIRL
jgi:2-succinyl-5-enolpyruvyl-6-hydroxy-3-cyclohexene-1-carboxylate synthase